MNIHIWKNDSGELMARIEGNEFRIALVKFFPLAPGENSFGIFELDVSGKKVREIVSVFDWEWLTEEARKIVKEDLLKNYPLIEIIEIRSIVPKNKQLSINVKTAEGCIIFETSENGRDIIEKGHAAFIKDDRGRFFYIDYDRLDARSRTILEEYI